MDIGKITRKIKGMEETFPEKYLEENEYLHLLDFYNNNGNSNKKYSIFSTITDPPQQSGWTKPPYSIIIDGPFNFVLGDEDYHLETLGFWIEGKLSHMTQLQRMGTEYLEDIAERLKGLDYARLLIGIWKSCCEKSGIKKLRIESAGNSLTFPPSFIRHETMRSLLDEEVDTYYRRWAKIHDKDLSESQIKKNIRRILSKRKGWWKNYDGNALRLGFKPVIENNGRTTHYYLEI